MTELSYYHKLSSKSQAFFFKDSNYNFTEVIEDSIFFTGDSGQFRLANMNI
jgi:hypothetical protein